jgi:CubicO group peptidase (beta-lactamase class C family)
MKPAFQFAICLLLKGVFAAGAAGAPPDPPQTFQWQTAKPESQGMSSARLDALKERMIAHKTDGLLVARNDRIVLEWYAPENGPTKRHGTASLAKALVGGLSLAVAITDGQISLDDPASKFVPEWKNGAQKSRIKIRHLGSHTSGVEDAEADKLPHDKLTGWKGDFWKRLPVPNDPFTTARDKAPIIFEPGEKLSYSNPGIALLTYAVTAAIQDGPHKDVRSLLRERVMRPIDVPDAEWSCGYGQTFTVNDLPLVGSWGGGNYSARAAATIGRLLLREGDWDGKRLLSRDAVRLTTGSAGLPGDCGMGFWTNAAGRYPGLPRDAYWGAGAGDQLLLVVPSLNLIMVRNGQTIAPLPGEPTLPQDDVFTKYHDYRARVLFEPLIAAIDANTKPATPQEARQGDHARALPAGLPPASPVISKLIWAPKQSIVRRAKGGDNWPMTWADDDQQYTAYGDGAGFEPFIGQKLSMGLCRIEGGPNDFRGVNLRSATFEHKGDGMQGRKASGMLMVDGVLYLLARNAANAQLAWSADHGKTWTWSEWKFTTSFGCPTFLNFGKNYSGARDDYVYVYSQDHDSAYEPADRMVLARVPKARLKDQSAYEFFQGLDAGGGPTWTKRVEGRGAVFSHPGKCYRSGITYNPALKRYLWCQILHASRHPQGQRFQGGFGIYDAPQPWGPWTTVFYTDDWDVGPGETSSFPTKWMSSDGKTLHLVFSGDDYFSVRKATVTLRNE